MLLKIEARFTYWAGGRGNGDGLNRQQPMNVDPASASFGIDTIWLTVNRLSFILVSSQRYPAKKLQSWPVSA